MNQDSLPRPLAKYLAGLPAAVRDELTPRLAQVHEALQQENATVDRVLAVLATAPGLKPDAEAILIEALARLPHPLLPAVLASRFGARPEKAIQKALKKAWHQLKVQGIEISPELVKAPGTPIISPVQEPTQVKAFVSRIEGNGSRMIIFHLPGLGQSFNLFVVLANDVEGLKDAYAVPMSNKEVKLYLNHIRSELPGKLAPVDPAYALGVLEACFQIDPESTAEAAVLYRQVRPTLQHRLEHATPPAIQSLLPPLDPAGISLDSCVELLFEEDFLNWPLEPEDIQPLLEKLAAVQNSPLHLTEEQQQARYDDIMTTALQELFPPEQRRRLSDRLLHMAYYLDRTDRPYLARLAQAAGEDLARERSILEKENPFLVGLFMVPVEMLRRSLPAAEEEPPPAGRIITDF